MTNGFPSQDYNQSQPRGTEEKTEGTFRCMNAKAMNIARIKLEFQVKV